MKKVATVALAATFIVSRWLLAADAASWEAASGEIGPAELALIRGADNENNEIGAAGICESQSINENQVTQYTCAGHPGAPCVACVPSSYSDTGVSQGGYHRGGLNMGACAMREKKIGICTYSGGVYTCESPKGTDPKSNCEGDTPKVLPQAP